MERHADVPRVDLGPRVVLSNLGAGESLVGSAQPSLKLLLEGEEIYRAGKTVYRLVPGRMLLVDPGTPLDVTIRRSERTRGLCVYFGEPLPLPSADKEPVLGRVAMRAANATPLGKSLQKMAAAAHFGDAQDLGGQALAIADCAAAVLHGSLEEARQHQAGLALKRPSTRRNVLDRIEIARAFLHDNLDRNVLLAELASASGLSAFHLARYFSAAVGMPPMRYHRAIRMARALELLQSGHVSVTEVSEQLGYSELSAFSHAFSREFGHPPTQRTGA